MGLCKCERKRVTNLFCFEHRVNVCEFCMVSSHKKCVVKSYLRWLKDSNFTPTCSICHEQLDDSDKECIRLVCLDVFHWECLDAFVRSAPPTTTPAGYLCPSCGQSIIPQSNHGGPVAEALRAFLDKVEWSKDGFSNLQTHSLSFQGAIQSKQSESHTLGLETTDKILDPRLDAAARQFLNGQELQENYFTETSHKQTASCSIHSDYILPSEALNQSPKTQRRETFTSLPLFKTQKEDDDKYKRRVALTGISRWFKSYLPATISPPKFRKRRFLVLMALFFIVALLTFSHVHQTSSTEKGSLFDPHMNPEIHLDEQAAAAIQANERAELQINRMDS